MKLLIIRHGDPDYSIDSLTEKGWKEADLLSKRLAKEKIDAFFCSPLGRAKDTAKATLEKHGAKAEILPWLEEFRGRIVSQHTGNRRIPWDLSPRDWMGEPAYYDKEKWTQTPLMQSGNVKEIFEETAAGVDALLKSFGITKKGDVYTVCEKEEKTVALFCHMGLGLAVVAYLTGVSPMLLWHNFFLPTSSVTTLVTETGEGGDAHFRCVQMGDTSHLYAGGEPISKAGLYPYENFKM